MLFVTLLHRYIAVFALNKALACLWLVLFVAFDCELITRPLSHDPEQPVPPSLPPPLHAAIVYSPCPAAGTRLCPGALQLRDYQRAARPHSFLPLTHAYQHQSDTLFI